METPDANGYVHVKWPSKTIPHGGIFHVRTAETSVADQKFLKVLLEESKLSITQRQKQAWALRQEDEPRESRSRIDVPMIRPRTSKRRSLSAIRESGVFKMEQYQPLKRGEDREALKAKLALSMERGDPPEQQAPPPPLRVAKAPTKPQLPTAKDMKHELLTQIRERVEWLAEMEELGHGAPHRDVVRDQIAERMRMLDTLGIDIDSACTSARSQDSYISTTRKSEKGASARSKDSAKSVHSKRSNRSQVSQGKQAFQGVTEGREVHSNRSNKSQEKQLPQGLAELHSNRSNKCEEKQKSSRSNAKASKKIEENILAYNNIPVLQYSPRRRV